MRTRLRILARRNVTPHRIRCQQSAPHRVLRLQRPDRQPIEPLCKTNWNQSWPYNNLCPTLNGQLSVTGCVATAMSQAMKYHNWPAIGQGSNSYTWDNGNRVLTADFSQMSFNWSDMTDTYNRSTSTEAQQTAVATLMKAAGYSVNMNYSPSASGAASIYIAPALGNNFRYDKSLSYLMRDWFSLPEWEDLIYTSLQTYGPVIYDGQSTGGGHSFICDGYSTDGLFHINWGWGGISDGYFLLDVLDPYEQGIGGGSNSGFAWGQDIICNIRPDQTGDSQWNAAMAMSNSFSMSYNRKSGTVKLSGFFYNVGPGPIVDGMLGFEFTPVSEIDLPTGEKTVISLSLDTLNTMYGFSSFELDLSDLPMGRSICRPVYALNENDEPKPLYAAKANSNSCIVHRAGSSAKFYPVTAAIPEFLNVEYPTSLETGDSIHVSGTMLNTVNSANAKNIFVAILSADGTKFVTRAGTEVFTMEADETLDFTYSKEITDYSSMESGKYSMALACNDGGANSTLMLLTEPWQFTYKATTGINAAGIDNASEAREYFTPDGVRVARRLRRSLARTPAGVYLVRTGNTTHKIVVR